MRLLERLPIRWNPLIHKEALRFKAWNMSERALAAARRIKDVFAFHEFGQSRSQASDILRG